MGYKGTTAESKDSESLADLCSDEASQRYPMLKSDAKSKDIMAVPTKMVW
jgi:hypothetical protein